MAMGTRKQFPDVASKWKEVGRRGLSSFIEKPISALTFGELVERYYSSGAIEQKTLTKKES